jgi:hypothetical protein
MTQEAVSVSVKDPINWRAESVCGKIGSLISREKGEVYIGFSVARYVCGPFTRATSITFLPSR